MMRLPRPASPRALWRDIKAFASERGPHHWFALGMALLIPAAIVITFTFDYSDRSAPRPQIIYVDSWRADRSAEETRANIEQIELRRKEGEERRREGFQRLQNKFGL